MAGSMLEKLNKVKDAEEKGEQILKLYRQMSEEAVARAEQEAARLLEREKARARKEGEAEMQEMIARANREAEELRVEYTYDRLRLQAVVLEKRQDAVAFLANRLEDGDQAGEAGTGGE